MIRPSDRFGALTRAKFRATDGYVGFLHPTADRTEQLDVRTIVGPLQKPEAKFRADEILPIMEVLPAPQIMRGLGMEVLTLAFGN